MKMEDKYDIFEYANYVRDGDNLLVVLPDGEQIKTEADKVLVRQSEKLIAIEKGEYTKK